MKKIKFDILAKIVEKTIGFDLCEGIKAMTPEESEEWHKKHSYRKNNGDLVITWDEISEEQKKILENT